MIGFYGSFPEACAYALPPPPKNTLKRTADKLPKNPFPFCQNPNDDEIKTQKTSKNAFKETLLAIEKYSLDTCLNTSSAIDLFERRRPAHRKRKIVQDSVPPTPATNDVDTKAIEYLIKAREYTNFQDYESAQTELEKAIAENPSVDIQAQIYMQIAYIDERLHQFENALMALESGLALKPSSRLKTKLFLKIKEIKSRIEETIKAEALPLNEPLRENQGLFLQPLPPPLYHFF